MQIHIHSKRGLVNDLIGGEYKMKFKKWVEILLQFVTIIAVFFLAAECDDFKLFVISKSICLAIILINITLLKKYGRLEDE